MGAYNQLCIANRSYYIKSLYFRSQTIRFISYVKTICYPQTKTKKIKGGRNRWPFVANYFFFLQTSSKSSTFMAFLTHICAGKLTIAGSDNGLSPGRRQAIIVTIAGILLFGPLETNFCETLIGIYTFAFKKMHLKMSSAKSGPFCFGLNV